MGLVGDILHALADFAQQTMVALGYPGLFLLMTMESMVFPVPSEAVMPYAGYLIATGATSWHGTWDWPGAVLVSSLGSIFGSYLSYLMGQYGLLPLVERYGKYVLIHKHHIESAHRWFERRGAWAIFICRFIPGVRHVISIPAGSARMPLRPFLLATFAGATIWNVILLWIGYEYGVQAADAIKPHLDVAGLGLLALIAAYVTFEVMRGRKHRRAAVVGSASQASPDSAPLPSAPVTPSGATSPPEPKEP